MLSLVSSRPIRAVVLVFGCWTGIRAVALWPVSEAVTPATRVPSTTLAGPAHAPPPAMPLADRPVLIDSAPPQAIRTVRLASYRLSIRYPVSEGRAAHLPVQAHVGPVGKSAAARPFVMSVDPFVGPGAASDRSLPRVTGSLWLLARSDGATALASAGQLGGSQTGARLYYQTGVKGVSLTGRISAPLAAKGGREASLGAALLGNGFGLLVEQRVALSKAGQSPPSVTAFAGVSDVAMPQGFRLDGYAQAGLVGIASPAGFVDAAVSIDRTIVRRGRASVSGGAGVWGAAQPDVSRLDVGPQIIARVPVAGRWLRASADYRWRIAGNARPASGPSLTLATDF